MKNWVLLLSTVLPSLVLSGQTKNPMDDGRKIRIPVVFHVIYDDSKENINDTLILKELSDLNSDYVAKNDMTLLDNSFRDLVGNPNIEFYLLDSTLQKTGIKGVDRISTAQYESRDESIIDPTNCVNIFVADQGNASDILSDRVNLNFEDVGTHSHVLTHETGHWLGLYHIFGQIGNSSWLHVTFGNNDDLIDDTPSQMGATAVCYEITRRCPCPPEDILYKKHKTMYNNFMDYNPCRCMFSVKQAIKMRNNIIGHKQTLFDKSKL